MLGLPSVLHWSTEDSRHCRANRQIPPKIWLTLTRQTPISISSRPTQATRSISILGSPKHALLFFTLVAASVGCSTNPVTGQQEFVLMSEKQELAVGRRANEEILKQYQIYPDRRLQLYVTKVGQRLAGKSHRANLAYYFNIVDSMDINAFALPGGYIYITRGLLAYLNSEAQLAAVLAHEIGHVAARHSVRQQTSAQTTGLGIGILSKLLPPLSNAGFDQSANLLGTALLRGYGREHELEADRLGAHYLERSGYDPQAMFEVIRILKEQEIFDHNLARLEKRQPRRYHGVFSTHPNNDTRLRKIVDHQPKKEPVSRAVFRDRFLDEIDGMVFGPNPSTGIIRETTFYHRDLGFAIQFPTGWNVSNQPDRVIATNQDNDLQIHLTGRAVSSGVTPEELLLENGIADLSAMEPIGTAGIAGVRGLTTIGTEEEPRIIRVSGIVLGEHGFVITGFARNTGLQRQFDETFKTVVMSFHGLSSAERSRAIGQRIRVINLKASIPWATLAGSSPLDKLAESHLKLLNASATGESAPHTNRIKVVE